ncbi:hypothetical protein P3X46_010731 [Hevea brasiliensis]|uniref:FAS1 domain-containing protein n=1 Tax=Hevea brasiliensis TaxID=3981 RepID=A0ABQ9MJ26_HEVBR|nr:fasciclin-like arabinogalactan protein 14 [Hevea brasiliensis]KAJ9178884.1 hypothetical protein P3X46_010731 [Hevea brasiliensis]
MSLISFSASHFALFFSFFLLFSTVSTFNITRILSNYSDFGNFNDMLSRTQLADAINSRRTITVLAVDNGNVSPLNGLSSDVQKRVLSLHVILDYYDLAKLQRLSKKSAILTTLYQSTGQAGGKEGFLNVTDMGGDQVAFGSAVAGSSLNANLVQSVTAQPYNISVLQVSSLIMPESVTKSNTSTKTPSPAKAPAPSKAKPPAPASDMAPAPADADSPTADTPSNSPSPAADSSASSPFMDGPTADSPDADSHSGGASANVGKGTSLAMVAMILSFGWGLAKMI